MNPRSRLIPIGGGGAGLWSHLQRQRSSSLQTAVTTTSVVSLPMMIVVATVLILQSFGLIQSLLLMSTSMAQQGVSWYLTQLNTFPLITKSITSGLIGVVGDFFAQWVEYRLGRRRTTTAAAAATLNNNGNHFSIHGMYDARRGMAILVDGMFVSGPMMHWGYDFLEKIIPISSGAASLAAMIHVVADSLVLDSIFVGTAMVGTGLLEGYKFRKDVIPQLKRDYAATLKAGWTTSATLIPLQFVCFRFLPVTLRTVAMNLTDVIWNGIISFMAHRSRHKGEIGSAVLV